LYTSRHTQGTLNVVYNFVLQCFGAFSIQLRHLGCILSIVETNKNPGYVTFL
jgi:hypothetical protein